MIDADQALRLLQIGWLFLRAGLISFGGFTATLPFVQGEVVGRYGWMTQSQFADGFALSRVVPGPGAQAAVFMGQWAGGVPGTIVTLVCLHLPTFALVVFVAAQWRRLSRSSWMPAIRRGLGPVVIGLYAATVVSLAEGAITDLRGLVLAIAATAAMVGMPRLGALPIVLTAAVIGLVFL
ncbi:MAG: chromate transporter [Chloroflexi bacterium]|nr:chromate transporter [Chloroflexota bacterium]